MEAVECQGGDPLETRGLISCISCMALVSFPLRKEWAFPDECGGGATLQVPVCGALQRDGGNSTSRFSLLLLEH